MAHRVNDIVLVHGGFVAGSGWGGVYRILENDGFNVSIVQNPTLSLEGDVAATKLIIDQQPGDVILVGHSYGGAVITQAGTHLKVAGLVYITAFAPDANESVNTLIANPPPGAPVPPILPPTDGYLFLDKQKFGGFVCSRRGCRYREVHGGFAGSVGRGRVRRHDYDSGMEDQAELVSACYR